MTLVRMLHDLDCELTALEIRVALRMADQQRAELKAYQRWQQHRDRTRVSAKDWAAFEWRQYEPHSGPRRKAVLA